MVTIAGLTGATEFVGFHTIRADRGQPCKSVQRRAHGAGSAEITTG